MNQAAQEIRDGLSFLLKQADEIGVAVNMDAEYDIFYVSITDGYISSENVTKIQSQMEMFGWTRNEDELLSFSHHLNKRETMNQAAQEIRDGLSFLLNQANASVDIGVDCDFFYASITEGHMTSENIYEIQSQMILLGWTRNEDELLSFSHHIN